MKIKPRYSHLNGEEFLIVHHSQLPKDIEEAAAETCWTKVSKVCEKSGKHPRLLIAHLQTENATTSGGKL